MPPGYGHGVMSRDEIAGLFDQMHEGVLAHRIAVACQRDGQLNEGELDAALEVYGEFGR